MRKILLLSGIIIVGFVLIFAIPSSPSVPAAPTSTEVASSTPAVRGETSDILEMPKVSPKVKTEGVSFQKRATSTPVAPVVTKSLTLIAGDAKYSVPVTTGATVYDSMQLLASTTSFKFTAKEFSGLGFRVESINGKANDGGTYWTLYINGEYANVGASTYVPKEGDVIEWKYIKL